MSSRVLEQIADNAMHDIQIHEKDTGDTKSEAEVYLNETERAAAKVLDKGNYKKAIDKSIRSVIYEAKTEHGVTLDMDFVLSRVRESFDASRVACDLYCINRNTGKKSIIDSKKSNL